jgi:hypothetical protein
VYEVVGDLRDGVCRWRVWMAVVVRADVDADVDVAEENEVELEVAMCANADAWCRGRWQLRQA